MRVGLESIRLPRKRLEEGVRDTIDEEWVGLRWLIVSNMKECLSLLSIMCDRSKNPDEVRYIKKIATEIELTVFRFGDSPAGPGN
jgi:hypothetical protein